MAALDPFEGGDGVPWWLPLITPQVVLGGLIGVLVLLAVVIVVGCVAYRRLRHNPRLGRALLTLRTEYEPAGPRREAARLQLRVQEALASAHSASSSAGSMLSPPRTEPALVQDFASCSGRVC